MATTKTTTKSRTQKRATKADTADIDKQRAPATAEQREQDEQAIDELEGPRGPGFTPGV